MFLTTPPVIDISRTQLKALSAWIRDELGPLVVRNGPEALRSDDVVILHEVFTMIRRNTSITALDLRSSGIHRAIQEIAGTATRWPSRLCDDCNRIIALWTAKFGPLSLLHPFLYGRGGRLEGIANVNDYSRDALLKRWSREQTDRNKAHRAGSLGFRAGDWWVNTLFAHHAGIIGLEALDGGMTFDKDGAYALVLNGDDETSIDTGQSFSYCMKQSDKGRYRLTAATPRSREPVRILRSHHGDSLWRPKAGLRYDGLHKVVGWKIRTVKVADTQGSDLGMEEILFDIQFERVDEIPMTDVICRPTATEADDYAEYKRLRKIHRAIQAHNIDSGEPPVTMDVLGNTAPKIEASQYFIRTPPISLPTTPQASPDMSRRAVFWSPHWASSCGPLFLQQSDKVSPKTMPEPNSFELIPKGKDSIPAPALGNLQPEKRGNSCTTSRTVATFPQTSNTANALTALSKASSADTRTSTSQDMKDIAPWMEFDTGMDMSIKSESNITGDKLSQKASKISSEIQRQHFAKSTLYTKGDDKVFRQSTTHSEGTCIGEQPTSMASTIKSLRQSSRESTMRRTKNPMAIAFNGPAFGDATEDYYGNAVRMPKTESVVMQSPSRRQGHCLVTSNDRARIHSPIPVRLFNPQSPAEPERQDSFHELRGLPPSSNKEGESAPMIVPGGDGANGRPWARSIARVEQTKEIMVVFNDPFPRFTRGRPFRDERMRRNRSSGIAPDEVV